MRQHQFTSTHSVDENGTIKNIVKNKILAPYIAPNGYCRFYHNKKHYLVHRLVALAFITNPYNHDQVNHKNGVKTDNRIDNLEWVSASQNMVHAIQNKLKCMNRIPVNQLLNGIIVATYKSAYETRLYGFNSSQVNKCCNGKSKTHKGFEWCHHNRNAYSTYRKPIEQYLNGELVAEYESLSEAKRNIKKEGFYSGCSISNNLKGLTNSAYGYVWKYKKQ